MVIALDRQERGRDARSAIQEVEETLGVRVISIVKLEHLAQYLLDRTDRAEEVEKIRAYRAKYGVLNHHAQNQYPSINTIITTRTQCLTRPAEMREMRSMQEQPGQPRPVCTPESVFHR